eukprot:GILK01006104.1.p1 GENE.GILK01006104.1~~GILK01006104.1.p1  ORF type:complete len:278 (+),score=9.09 GILK01006104.1:34-867(+)
MSHGQDVDLFTHIHKDTIPPLHYPPSWGLRKALLAVVFCIIAMLCCYMIEFDTKVDGLVRLVMLFYIGYLFVAYVTLGRPNPWLSRYKNYAELLKLLLSGIPLYFFGPHIVLQGLSSLGTSLYFVIPFFVGLHFTYFDTSPTFQSLGCKVPLPSQWHLITWREAVALLCSVGLVGLIVGFHVTLLVEHDWIHRLGLGYLASTTVVWVISKTCQQTHYLHMHHYFLFLPLLPCMWFRTPISTISQALIFGVYVEGIAVWGMDPILVAKASRRNIVKLE